jgi:hypothetical protein
MCLGQLPGATTPWTAATMAVKDISTFETVEHLQELAPFVVLSNRAIKEVYVYVAIYVSGFDPRVCPNAK